MNPELSVIVPVYNAKEYLKRCLDSLLAQTFGGIEIILVDDGSTDGSGRLCDEYAKQDRRVQVIHKANQGAGLARNTGIQAASGVYIGFADADDYVAPDMYGSLYRTAVQYDADIVMAGVWMIGGSLFAADRKEEKRYCFESCRVFDKGAGMKELLLGTVGALPQEPEDTRYGFSVWKNIYRRECIVKNRLAFESEREFISEDLLFLVDFFSCAKKAVGMPGAYYYYWRNESSFSKSYRKDRFEYSRKMWREIKKRLSRIMPEEEFKLYTDRYFQSCVRISVAQEIGHADESRESIIALKKRLKEICMDEEVRRVYAGYPYWRLPLKQAIFAFAVRFRLIGMQRLLVHFRKKIY